MTVLSEYREAFEDFKKRVEKLKEFEELYIEASKELIKADATIQNQQQVIDTTRKTLDRLTKENKCLKQLLIGEWDV